MIRKIAALVGLAALLSVSCGGSGSTGGGTGTATATAGDSETPPVVSATPPPPVDGAQVATIGPVLAVSAAMPNLPFIWNDERVLTPAIGYQDVIVASLGISPIPGKPVAVPEFEYGLIDPTSGEFTSLWKEEPGKQDAISGTDNEWLAMTRTGLSLPFPDWDLIIHNPETGERRTIASDNPLVVKTSGFEPKLPRGFAPAPSLSEGRVVWVAIDIDPDGSSWERVWLHDIASDTRTLIAETPDPARISSFRRLLAASASHGCSSRTTGASVSWLAILIPARVVSSIRHPA